MDRKPKDFRKPKASGTPCSGKGRCINLGLRAHCSVISTWGLWSKEETNLHISILKSIAAKVAILTLTKKRSSIVTYLHINNQAVLSYLVKIRWTNNKHLLDISKEIWQYLLVNQIMIIVE